MVESQVPEPLYLHSEMTWGSSFGVFQAFPSFWCPKNSLFICPKYIIPAERDSKVVCSHRTLNQPGLFVIAEAYTFHWKDMFELLDPSLASCGLLSGPACPDGQAWTCWQLFWMSPKCGLFFFSPESGIINDLSKSPTRLIGC